MKIGLIIAEEYRRRVMKRSFILLTVLTPLLLSALILVPLWLSSLDDEDDRQIALIDRTGLYRDAFESDLYDFEPVDDRQQKNFIHDRAADYQAFLVIDADPATRPAQVRLYSEKVVPKALKSFIDSRLNARAEHIRLSAYGIEGIEQMIADAKTDISVTTIRMKDDGSEENSNGEFAAVLGILTTFLIYMFIFISGQQVMNSVVQEKANRIVEVMICSVRPAELMWGKIIGVALTALTQMAIWVVLIGVIMGTGLNLGGIDPQALAQASPDQMEEMSLSEGMLASAMQLNWGLIISMFLAYFLVGYLFYATLFAAIGASVDNESDTSQFMTPITAIVLFALYAAIYSAENPDGPLAFWCSIIPFTSPMVMMVRLPFGVPTWQLLLSLGLLSLTVVGMVHVASRIYRTGLLMYGKKPTWRELYRWIRQ